MAAGQSALEEFLLEDLHDTDVYDLAADLGIVHGHLQGPRGWPASSALSPAQQLPATGLTPPPPPAPSTSLPPPPSLLPAGAVHQQQQHQAPPPLLRYHADPAELQAANDAVGSCLQAAEAAAAALHLAGLQLEQWGGEDLASPATAATPGTAADSSGSPSGPAAAAAASGEPQAAAGVPRSSGGEPTSAAAAAAGNPASASKRKRGGAASARQSAADPSAPAAAGAAGGSSAAAAAAAGVGSPAAAQAAAAAAGGGGGGGARQGPGKGLRHFSLKVCEKVESKGDTSYEEVANELIGELKAEVAAGLVEQLHDEKNIRRRVYDALNVLEAIGMITKTKKAIQWRGWPSGLGRSPEERLRADRARALEGLERKRKELQDAVEKAYCISNLALRNAEAPLPLLLEMREAGLAVPNPLTLPFMLVQADQDAEVEVNISHDNLHAHIDFKRWPFVLYDDDLVMHLMQLHVPQPHLYATLQRTPDGSQQQQVQQQQQQQGAEQEPAVSGSSPDAAQHQQGGPALLQPYLRPQHAQQQHQNWSSPPQQQQARDGVTPRKLSNRLPTPALQLSPDLGSPPCGLGSGMSAIELSSPPGTAAQQAAAAGGGRQVPGIRPQQPFLRPALGAALGMLSGATATAAGAGGIKLEDSAAGREAGLGQPFGAFGAAHAQPSLQPHSWPAWDSAAAGQAFMAAGPGPMQQQQQQHVAYGVPQLRPAAPETLQLSFWQQQQQQQQQQQGAAGVPTLRPARQP